MCWPCCCRASQDQFRLLPVEVKQRRPARDGLGAVLNAEASNLQAVVEKHVVENMVSRLEKWARAVVTAAAAHIDADQAWQQQQQPQGLRLPRDDLKATETKALVGAVRRALYSPAGQVLAPYTLTGKVRQAWLDRIVQQLQLAVQSPLGQALSTAACPPGTRARSGGAS